jgi:hypothetical protein
VPELHPFASEDAPFYISAPGETDWLYIVCVIILVLAVLGFGLVFFRLHSLPELIAHKGKRVQYEVVAVLALISLFTHEHIFWIIALVLAFIDLPDFGTPLNRIAGSAEKMVSIASGQGAGELPVETAAEINQTHQAALVPSKSSGGGRQRDVDASAPKVEAVSPGRRS